MKLRFLVLAFLPVLAFAQQNPLPQAVIASDGNFLQNGNFEQFTSKDNLWDGVDSEGFLAGFPGTAEVVQEGGRVGRMGMAISVQVADLNGDGLLDLMTSDALGYLRVYFNQGTKAEPKFSNGEIVPLFLRRYIVSTLALSCVPKISLADFTRSGTMDLVIGNYIGELLIIKNTGNRSIPEWRQPTKMEGVIIPTADEGRLWTNVMAPAAYDWNHDGKMDVLVGEGSYSANAIHLLLNEGSSSVPKFSEDARHYLAYGDGREQLIPAVVDYNGDGNPDLLVGDRTGNIEVYLSKGPWKNGDELERVPTSIMFGNIKSIGNGATGAKCVSPTVADLNSDNLFDILIGEPNGRIAVSYNTGTPTAPKFGPPVELKGEDVWKKDTLRTPALWDIYFGELDGNFLGSYTVVSPEEDPQAAPTNSKHVLKFEYFPVQNKIVRKPPLVISGTNKITEFHAIGIHFRPTPVIPHFWTLAIDRAGWLLDSNTVMLRQKINFGVLKPNTNYKLSFKVKGRGVKEAMARFTLCGWLQKGSGTDSKSLLSEQVHQIIDFSVPPSWTPVNKQINMKFEAQKDLNTPDKWSGANQIYYAGVLEIRAAMAPDASVLYIDDVRVGQ